MYDFTNLFPKDLYHSYIIESDPIDSITYLRKFLEERGDIDLNSNDVLCQTYDAFSMEDSLCIKEWNSEIGITDKKRVCIIGAKFINHDAERTLLKMLEEPSINTHFFIIVPNSNILIDTIRSRAHIIKIKEALNVFSVNDAKNFITVSTKERIDIVAQIIKDKKDNEGSGGIRYTATLLVNELEKIIYEKFLINKNDKKIQFILSELNKAREYLSIPGSSPKMILEHIALILN